MPLDILTPKQLDVFKADVKSLLEDPEITSDFIYRRLISSVYDPAVGQSVVTFNDVPLKGARGNHSIRDIAGSGGLLAIGDQMMVFDGSLVGGDLSTRDKLLITVTSAGAVNVVQGQSVVEAYDTVFMTDGVMPGDFLKLEDETMVQIASVGSEEQLTLNANWSVDSRVEAPYQILRLYSIVMWMRDPITKALRVSYRRVGS